MEAGFHHLGLRELAAVWLAVVIIADWAAVRYAPPRPAPSPREDRRTGAPR